MKTKHIPEVYLAGPIQHAADSGHGWRDRVIENHNDEFAFLNPLDKYDATDDVFWLAEDETIPEVQAEYGAVYTDDHDLVRDADIVEGDKQMIQDADALLINFPESVPAWGTPMEMAYVAFRPGQVMEIPIVFCHGDFRPSPWATYHADYVTQDLDSGLNYIAGHYHE